MTMSGPLHMPALDGAAGWLNSPPLSPAELRGHPAVVNFWTLTCINWLRQEPYVRAWSRAYRDDGLVVIGVHTPEFFFEHDIDLVRQATKERDIDYPVAVDNHYAIWNAFDNHYWPALYFIDSDGVIVGQHFGEGEYEQSERVIQRLLGVDRRQPRSPSRGGASRRRPTGITCARPRPTWATGAARASPHPAAWSRRAGCTGSPRACRSTSGRWPGTGPSSRRRPPSTTRAGASPSASRRATRIW